MEENCHCCKQRMATHEILFKGKTTFLCCICYVREGFPPSDWHKLCMETYRKIKSNTFSEMY